MRIGTSGLVTRSDANFLQATREFLGTMKQHCERELFLQWCFEIEQLPDLVKPISVVAIPKYFKALERCVRSVLDFKKKLSPSALGGCIGKPRRRGKLSIQPWR